MNNNSREPMHFATMSQAYPALRNMILDEGVAVSPRGEETIEVLGASFRINNAVTGGVPIGLGRKVGKKMMALDGSANLSGKAFPDVNIKVAPVLERFADVLDVHNPHLTANVFRTSGMLVPDSKFFQGAYGPRMADQLIRCEAQLRRDQSTRQAIVSLWREEDADPFWKDRPCTTEIQLMIRDGKVDIFVFMRANDLWTGTCYDVFQFGQIQAAMAHILGLQVGAYHHYATSLHIYQRDIAKFRNIRYHAIAGDNPRETAGPAWDSLEPGEYTSWTELQERFTAMLEECRLQINHDQIGMWPRPFEPRNPVEAWYYDILNVEGQS